MQCSVEGEERTTKTQKREMCNVEGEERETRTRKRKMLKEKLIKSGGGGEDDERAVAHR